MTVTTTMVKIKDYKLRTNGNAKGKLVQIPVALIREWDLGPGDTVEMYKTVEGDLVIKPKRVSV